MPKHSRIEEISALAELDRIGWAYEPAGDDEVRVRCPVHTDANPSVGFNTDKNVWKCHAAGCDAKGDIVTFLAFALKVDRETVFTDLSERYDLQTVKEISPVSVERHHTGIWDAGPLLQALRDRGVTDDDIRKYRIGFHDGRISIPITDAAGRYVNVRRYLPGAPGPQKMRNTRGYSQPRLFPIDQLEFDTIWIVGGEIKAIVAAKDLNPLGVGAIAVTGGEGTWDDAFSKKIEGKDVYVCMDVDKSGRIAAKKLARQLYRPAKTLRILRLPLSLELHPHGDYNDYHVTASPSPEDLRRLMESSEEFVPEELNEPKGEERRVHLKDIVEPDNYGFRLRFTGIVAAMDNTPYLVPKQVGLECNRDQPGCSACPVPLLDADEKTGFTLMVVPDTSQSILEMTGSGESVQRDSIMKGLKIPRCKTVKPHVLTHHKVVDVRLSPELRIQDEKATNVMMPAYCVGDDIDLNVPYEFGGALHAHPKTSQATLVVNEAHETEDSFNAFSVDESLLDTLCVFQPEEWTLGDIETKLDEVYADLERNVTRIFGRRDLHLALDLAFHSALMFELDGRLVNGWLNLLVVGDSSQGKTETTMRLMEHYRLGEKVDCKLATIAGLIGGLQQMGSKWFMSWGAIPAHDRRIVVLEELKGASTEVIGAMTDMRSSGIARVTKIERRQAHARTRLIGLSNSRSNRPMSDFSFGIKAVEEVMGNLEDIRRLDLTMQVSMEDVDAEVVIQSAAAQADVPHVYDSDLSRRLVLWAWTRTTEQIQFSTRALTRLRESSSQLSRRYSELFPLIDRGTIRHKLARLSVACAARTFSTDEHRECIVVRAAHVEVVVELMDRLYQANGYLKFSERKQQSSTLRDPKQLRGYLLSLKHPDAIVEALIALDEILLQDLQDVCDADRDATQTIVSQLVRQRALTRNRKGYRKSPAFIALLREMEAEGLPSQSRDGERKF